MNINNYKVLIANLPVRNQCFTTKRNTWKEAEYKINWLKILNDRLFGDKDSITISRQEIFDTTNLREKIIKTIYWGYTSGMRGNNFVNILAKIDLIEKELNIIKQTDRPTTEDFNILKAKFKRIKGLGLSTYSKLLYFLDFSFNNNSCLILDQRLINVFANNTFAEFQQLSCIRYHNAGNKYLSFLKLTKEVSKNIEVKEENIEQFLYIFGNSIK